MGVELDSAAVIQALKRGKAMMTGEELRAQANARRKEHAEMVERWGKYEVVDRHDTQLRMVVAVMVYFPAIVVAALLNHFGFLTPASVVAWVVGTTAVKRLGNVAVSRFIRKEYEQIDLEYERV